MTLSFYLATKNRNKVREARQILKETGIKVLLPEGRDIVYPEETGKTFRENALIKASCLRDIMGAGLFVGEDSGLVVENLAGLPGILSARFSGKQGDDTANIMKLIDMMKDYTRPEDRQAEFVTAVSLLGEGEKRFFEGRIKGTITFCPRGSGGFGYDPVFEIPSTGKTFAEITAAEKNRISHRAEAFKRLARYLVDKYAEKV